METFLLCILKDWRSVAENPQQRCVAVGDRDALVALNDVRVFGMLSGCLWNDLFENCYHSVRLIRPVRLHDVLDTSIMSPVGQLSAL